MGVEEGCRNARLGSGGRVPECEACKWREVAGKRGLEVEEGCRKARLGSVDEAEAGQRDKQRVRTYPPTHLPHPHRQKPLDLPHLPKGQGARDSSSVPRHNHLPLPLLKDEVLA